MGQLTADMIMKLANFRAEIITALTADLNAGMSVDAVSAAGALDLSKVLTELTISGTKAYTLAAPTAPGQRKIVRCVSAASIPAGTLTVSSPDNVTGFVCPTTFFFDTVGQELTFEATSALKWRCVAKKRAGVKAVTIGTTVLTGIADMSDLNLSVTGTVSSTSTMALPNGAAVGEEIRITVGTAALSPQGTLGGAFTKKDGTAGTTLSLFAAVTDQATLVWDGAGWKSKTLTPTTLVIA